MTQGQPSAGRFSVLQSAPQLQLHANGQRDQIQLVADDLTIAVSQRRNRNGSPTASVATITGLMAEVIGGPGMRNWALFAEIGAAPRLLMVHSITEAEARWLVGILSGRYPQIQARTGWGHLQDEAAIQPPPPSERPWSVDEWRQQPPIG